MPTIDQLAQATAASDGDELAASQNGITRKITRAQLVAGLQPQLAVSSGSLLGRSSKGTGAPEALAVGANLVLASGTLSGSVFPFDVSALPAGTQPAANDLIPVGQGGTNVAIKYAAFLSSAQTLDASQMTVTPTGGSAAVKLADFAASAVTTAGAQMQGPIALSGDPSLPLQAATKQYVDSQGQSALKKTGGTLTGALTLAADPATPLQAATKQYADARVQRTGDTMTGALTLAADPVQPLHAATKQYVDTADKLAGVLNVRSAAFGAKLDGTTDDTAAFKAAYQACAANGVIYVPAGIANIQSANSWGISIAKRVKWMVDGTTAPDGTPLASIIPAGGAPGAVYLPGLVCGSSPTAAEFSQAASTASDFAVLHSSYVVNHAGGPTGGVVATNQRSDTIIYNSPNNYIWGGLDRLQWNGTQTPDATKPAQHVARYVQAIRATAGTDSSGNALPQPQVWGACIQYIDQTGLATTKTNAAQGLELDFRANGPDDMNGGDGGRYLASFALLQTNLSGAPVEAGNGLLVTLIGGHQGSFKRAIRVAAPFSQAALCTRWSQQLSGGHAIWLNDGHHVAFNTAGTSYIAYDTATNTLRAVRGAQSIPIGAGLSLGWASAFTGAGTLDPATTGNAVFLYGPAPFTVTLPSAKQVASGTGWFLSNVGAVDVTLAPAAGEAIDGGSVVLHPGDRYYFISDQYSTWREVFRSNSIAPRLSGPLILASYAVAALPPGQPAGAKAFAANGRKPGEGVGAGTGVEVFFDGARWISVCGGSQVLA